MNSTEILDVLGVAPGPGVNVISAPLPMAEVVATIGIYLLLGAAAGIAVYFLFKDLHSDSRK